MPIHVRQVQAQKDQVVVIQLRKIDPLFPQIRRIDVQLGVGQNQFDALRCCWVVFDE